MSPKSTRRSTTKSTKRAVAPRARVKRRKPAPAAPQPPGVLTPAAVLTAPPAVLEASVLGSAAPGAPPVTGTRELPVLPIRHTVLFPYAILPLNIGRERSVRLLQDVMAGDRSVVLVAQKDGTQDEPGPADVHEVGTLGGILRMIRVADDRFSVLVQGTQRVKIENYAATSPYLKARVTPLADELHEELELDALTKNVVAQFERVVQLSPSVPDEAAAAARNQETPGRLADFIASLLDMPVEDKQKLLEMLDVNQRLRTLTELLERDLQVLEVGQQIQETVRENIDKGQREFVLRQQMEAIRKELGEGDDSQRELEELKQKIEGAQMPPDVRKEADRELARLTRIPAQAAEYTVARTYLETLCDMPWAVATDDNLDLKHARAVLDEDHYGLDKIKERILEYLVVRAFKKDARTPILCFVGPPGTGKTSLGRSIAKALGRKFVRQSLGGVRDEAEIRGHRRTYIGALPGNIIRGIRRAGSRNPVFMLDEIDKLGADFRGDPSSALLEVLDPEQNTSFVDHYLDVPFDLSQVLFVTTANYLDPVPPALRDRMEVIELVGYTDGEKLEIAKRHLIPKALRENGLESFGLSFTDEALMKLEREYSREAGLRSFEREIANLLRKTAKLIAESKNPPRTIGPAQVRELLGPERFSDEKASRLDAPGAVLGLAWTPAGGEVLTVEATLMPGSKQLLLTGQLGDVMKESAQAALSFVRSHTDELHIPPHFFEDSDIHIHLPAGAIPKDGPSAGVALCTAMVSLVTRRKARAGIAMTGEITLRGRVLKVGGIKEKVLGAYRAGIRTVILPADNQGDLEEVPIEVRTHMIFAPVERIEQALELALEEHAEPRAGERPVADGRRGEKEQRPPQPVAARATKDLA